MVKNLPAVQETWVQFLGREDPLDKGAATHSSILAYLILLLFFIALKFLSGFPQS